MRWLAFLVLFPTAASAGFIENKADWDETSQAVKIGFVVGWFDAQSFITGADEYNQYIGDRGVCVTDLGLTPGKFVEIIDSEYQDLESWDKPATFVLSTGLRKVCLATINRLRAERGQAPYAD